MKFPTLHVGRGSQVGPLTVFPLWADKPAPTQRFFSNKSGSLVVSEREGSPVVGELVVTNNSVEPVLLLAGDLLEGGWQHRAIAEPVLIAAGASEVVNVKCVERGRWSGAGEQINRGRKTGPRLRSKLEGSMQGKQHEVWAEVDRFSSMQFTSKTASYVDYLNLVEEQAVGSDVRPLDGQVGVVVAANGHPIMLEVFATHDDLVQAWDALISGALADTRGVRSVRTPSRRVHRFIDGLESVELSRTAKAGLAEKVVGLGESDRLFTSISGVEWDEELVHLLVLNQRHDLFADAH